MDSVAAIVVGLIIGMWICVLAIKMPFSEWIHKSEAGSYAIKHGQVHGVIVKVTNITCVPN